MSYTTISQCRSCSCPDLEEVLDLGVHAISDFPDKLFHADHVESRLEKAPLVLVRCASCTLVQLRDTVPPEQLFRRYHYKSGTNESMVAALQDVVDDALARVTLQLGDAVLDIGANDGTLLGFYPETVLRWAWEPADFTLPVGIVNMKQFFPAGWGSALRERFKVITSIAQFYNVPDPNAYVAAIKRLLHPEGIWVVQMMGADDMFAKRAFDNICHEHVTYWSPDSFSKLLARHGLLMADIRNVDVNGRSTRCIVKHVEAPRDSVLFWDCRPLNWPAFRNDIYRLKNSTLALIEALRGKVGGYGASTKFNTLSQFYGLDSYLLPWVADRDPAKWGKSTVTGIPIISEADMRERVPPFLFLGPWHFLDSFLEREKDWLAQGGQFVVPLPEIRIVGGAQRTSWQPARKVA